MPAPEEGLAHGRCHQCTWVRRGLVGPFGASCRMIFSPAAGSISLTAKLALPRLLSPGKGTADICVPHDGFSFPVPPWWSASKNNIYTDGAAEHGGQATKPGSTREVAGGGGCLRVGASWALALLHGCFPILPTLSWDQPRTEGARKDLLAMLHLSRSRDWNCDQTPGVSWGRKMKCFFSWLQLWSITAQKAWHEPLTGPSCGIGLLASM